MWDKRNMSSPVHESEQLGSFSREYPPMPLPRPGRGAAHSAFYLAVDPGGDVLVGRAENGEGDVIFNATYSAWPAGISLCKGDLLCGLCGGESWGKDGC